jgi:SsrA-binding protein
VSKPQNQDHSPRITNKRALHDYFISAKLECGIVLQGSEVKSLRLGQAQLTDSYATIERGQLVLHSCQIEPYKQAASAYNHVPKRDRRLLAHRREIHKLAKELEQRGTTLIPLAIYFKDGMAKCEIGVGKGKQQFDKRQTIKKKEQDRELRRVMSKRM